MNKQQKYDFARKLCKLANQFNDLAREEDAMGVQSALDEWGYDVRVLASKYSKKAVTDDRKEEMGENYVPCEYI